MAGRAVREHRHLPCPSSAQDISVQEAQPEICRLSSTQRLQAAVQVLGAAAGPAAEAGGTGSAALCPLLKEHGVSGAPAAFDKASERTGAAVFRSRGRQQLRSAALSAAWVQPGWASGLQVKPFAWVLPQAAPGPPVRFLETSGLGCCVRSLDCCCFALAIPLQCSSRICQDSMFPQEKEYGNGVMKRLSLQTLAQTQRSPLETALASEMLGL